MVETKSDYEHINFQYLPLSPLLIFSYLTMPLFPIMVYYADKFGVNGGYGFIAAMSLSIVVVASAMRKTKRYVSTTDLNEVQTQFNQFYYIWMPLLSGTISIFFYFDSVFGAFIFYILTGWYFFLIAAYFIFLEEKQNAEMGNLQDHILRKLTAFQFMIQTWFAFLLIHFWQTQKWGFLGLLLAFGVGIALLWLKPGTLVLKHALALRLFFYVFDLFAVWVIWTDFDLTHHIFEAYNSGILMKLLADLYLTVLSPNGLEKTIKSYRE